MLDMAYRYGVATLNAMRALVNNSPLRVCQTGVMLLAPRGFILSVTFVYGAIKYRY